MTMHPLLRPAVALVGLLGGLLAPALPARAQEASDVVKAEAKVPGGAVPPGAEAVLEVTLTIQEGWHIYGPGDFYDQDTILEVRGGAEGLDVGEWGPVTPPKAHKYEFDDGPRMEFGGTVTYRTVVRVPADAEAGTRILEGAAVVNTCNDMGCLPPGDVPFSVELMIDPEAAAPVLPPETDPVVDGPPGEGGAAGAGSEAAAIGGEEKGEISLAFLLTAVVAGLLTIATPCVFPMIPLTVSLLTKRAEKEPGKIFSSATVYGIGMFVSLAGIGLLMSLVFGVAPSDLALSAGFNMAIFVFLGYLAMSLFGAYDIQLPSFLTNWSQSKAGTGGGAGLFFMGMTLAFTSFACAAPFAGVLVVQARSDVVKGVVGMSVYAGTFTLPFFLTALFPGILKKLPRSGGWLNAVKVVMGFVEVAAAFKFLRAADMLWGWGFFSFEVVLAIWIACCIGSFLYLLGFIILPHDTKLEGIGVGRLLWALAFLSAGLFLVPGLFGRRIPPLVESFIIREDAEAGESGGTEEAALRWIKNDLDAALAEAKAAGKPVFVDFTGFG
jgi:thiol:disulfide interchange protein DsbD